MADNPTQFIELFDAALAKLTDFDLAALSQDDCYSVLFDYLRPACVKFKSCKQDLKDRDNLLQQFNIELTDDEIEILSNEIVIGFLYAKYLKTPMLLKPLLGNSKDFTVFSPGNHLKNLREFHRSLVNENEQLISMYSWNNSQLYDSGGGIY